MRSRTVQASIQSTRQPRKRSQSSTRSSTEVFLVGYPSSSISGSQLPTNRQAFQYFLYLQGLPENAGKPSAQELAFTTIDAILPFWHMARIKTMQRRSAMLLFMKLHDKHRNLMKNRSRLCDPGGKRDAFVLELDNLFDIGAADAIDEIRTNRLLSSEKKEEDIQFYRDQQTDRKGHMSGHDKIFEAGATRQLQRQERQQLQHDREHGR